MHLKCNYSIIMSIPSKVTILTFPSKPKYKFSCDKIDPDVSLTFSSLKSKISLSTLYLNSENMKNVSNKYFLCSFYFPNLMPYTIVYPLIHGHVICYPLVVIFEITAKPILSKIETCWMYTSMCINIHRCVWLSNLANFYTSHKKKRLFFPYHHTHGCVAYLHGCATHI